MNGFHRLLLSAAFLAALSACDRPEPEPTRAPPAPQGREETRGIRNTEAVGYSGNVIADKVDSVLDTSDQRTNQLDKALDQQQ